MCKWSSKLHKVNPNIFTRPAKQALKFNIFLKMLMSYLKDLNSLHDESISKMHKTPKFAHTFLAPQKFIGLATADS